MEASSCVVEEEDDHVADHQLTLWQEVQDRLRQRLKLCDDFSWKLPPLSCCNSQVGDGDGASVSHAFLRYVGGVDLSFWKKDPSVTCGAIVVIDLDTMNVVYEDFEIVHLNLPYLAGFLAFRESPVLLGLLEKLSREHPELYPQVLMVDGNGVLHPRGFGLASHLGVLADIPTIGVAKNLHHVDGLTRKEVQLTSDIKDVTILIGNSGQRLGAALRNHGGCKNPIYISIGHRISLETAVDLVQRCCKHRIPEPVRQADIRSREKIRIKFGN